MGRFLTTPRIAAATLILLIGSSASQAWFGRGQYYDYYYYTGPACAQASAPAASPTVAQATKPAVAPTAKPAVAPVPAQGSRTTYMPVTPPNAAQAAPATPAGQYCPPQQYQYQGSSGMSSGANMPRSSWDFGRWPSN